MADPITYDPSVDPEEEKMRDVIIRSQDTNFKKFMQLSESTFATNNNLKKSEVSFRSLMDCLNGFGAADWEMVNAQKTNLGEGLGSEEIESFWFKRKKKEE